MISPTPNVKNFDLNDDIFLDELENSLSVDRFRTYLTATDGDRVQAVRLYTWNTAVSAAFYGPLQVWKSMQRSPTKRGNRRSSGPALICCRNSFSSCNSFSSSNDGTPFHRATPFHQATTERPAGLICGEKIGLARRRLPPTAVPSRSGSEMSAECRTPLYAD